MKPYFYYPAKPYIVSQAWGISNPSYKQFGFSKHNGVDFLTGERNEVRAPLPLLVLETGYNDGAGNYARLVSLDKYDVADTNCYIGMMFMHAERVLVKKGDILKTGDLIMIADNTGFSTGPHTHLSCRRLSKQNWGKKYRLDTDKEADYTFDPRPYWNGFYAADFGLITTIMHKLKDLLAQLQKTKI